MEQKKQKLAFVVCVKNDNYSVSLEVLKIYQIIPDLKANKHHMLRVVDESGEDYLYPEDYFISIEVPQTVAEVFSFVNNH